MRPAFSTTSHAFIFALLLMLLAAAPVLIPKKLIPAPEAGYKMPGPLWGPYDWIHQQIFVETNDIDIAIMGSSRFLWGIDAPYIQTNLTPALGRPATVRMICWQWKSIDALYFNAKELLAHRRVKMLVFYDETEAFLHPMTPYWFNWQRDSGELAGLQLKTKLNFYFASIIGTPLGFLECLCPNLPPTPGGPYDQYYRGLEAVNPDQNLGSIPAKLGLIDPLTDNRSPYVEFQPEPKPYPAETFVYSKDHASLFHFANEYMPADTLKLFDKFSQLARAYNVKLVLVHPPIMAEMNQARVEEARCWPDLNHTDITMIGIPGAKFFEGMSPADIKKLYRDPVHFNQNGQRYFTRMITPALLKTYEKIDKP